MLKKLTAVVLGLALITGLCFGQSVSANRIVRYASTASVSCTTAVDVGKVIVDYNQATDESPLFVCSNTGVGTYDWVSSAGGAGLAGAGTSGQVTFFNASDSVTGTTGFTFDGTNFIAPQIKSTGLTSGRVVFAGAAGLLSDSANFTWSGTTLGIAGTVSSASLLTATNCSNAASPAVCGSAAAGSVAVPTGITTVSLVVNTTAVTANSEIQLTPDDSVTIAATTCNNTLATLTGGLAITARTPSTSFTITYNGTIATNPLCVSYRITN